MWWKEYIQRLQQLYKDRFKTRNVNELRQEILSHIKGELGTHVISHPPTPAILEHKPHSIIQPATPLRRLYRQIREG